jgi:mono/diheme cytochrome c family protein
MRMIRIRQTGLFGGMALGLALGGCNSFDEPADTTNGGARLVIPVDERPAVTAPTAPLPISGGTLSVLSDSSAAIVGDPERDRISIVDLASLSLRHTIALQSGDEPGRSVEDGQKHIHVALRSGGAIVSIDPLTGTILDRRAVCKAPRGIAFEAATGLLHVACAEGKLVSLPAQGGAAVRTLTLEADLRDVLVRGTELWVTRFKSAEVLRVSSVGTLDKRMKIPQAEGSLSDPHQIDEFGGSVHGFKPVLLTPGTAWRAVANATGGAVIVHQDTVADEIEITEPSLSGSAYGGGADNVGCGGIVKNVVSTVAPDGSVISKPFNGSPLPVDIAFSADQAWVAVAHAGPADFAAPQPSLVFPATDGPTSGGAVSFGGVRNAVTIMSLATLGNSDPCAFPEAGVFSEHPVTAVAFAANGRLLAQTREPAQLLVVQNVHDGTPITIALPGESRADTGHELFHRDAGGGIACASCHPEGGEDGRTWRFADTGERRTQPLHVGLRDTAPFHWAGDLPGLGDLMNEVFVGRMGGVRESAPRVSALSEWLFSIKPPASIRDTGDEAAVRGQELFRSTDVGCATCHSGAKLTNNESMVIDSIASSKLQVPSLVAIGYRAPFMHNGCAATLADRFNPACGGNAHGNTAALSEAQRNDLVAYLESL